MASTVCDEETPLLRDHQPKEKQATPLPWTQLTILLVLQLAEPLTSYVINPFAPQFVRESGITQGDEGRVGYYVGILQSLFFAAEAMTVLHWSRLSDHFGRKPIIMTGFLGLSLTMYGLGMSKTYWSAVVSRSLSGALNGNIGVLKSMVADITDFTNIAQAYAYLPASWATGQAIGPVIGGYLSNPTEQFPEIFGNNDFLKEYPYFLACAIPASYSAVACVVTLLFLKESVKSPRSLRSLIKRGASRDKPEAQNGLSSSPCSSVGPADEAGLNKDVDCNDRPLPLKEVMTSRVVLSSFNYACVAMVDTIIRSVQPVFFSTPIEMGGLGLPPYLIGRILMIYGVLYGLTQMFLFARIHDRFGTKKVHVFSLASALVVFASFPIISMLAKAEHGNPTFIWAAVGFQVVISIIINFSYGCVIIYLTASSPNKASLGTVNGFAQVGVSIMRTIGPATANSLFSLSVEEGYLGGNLVYVVLSLIVCFSLYFAYLLPGKVWARDETPESSGR